MGMRSTEIGNELMRLLDQQTEFLSKTSPTPEELTEYERWRERIGNCSQNWSSWQRRHKKRWCQIGCPMTTTQVCCGNSAVAECADCGTAVQPAISKSGKSPHKWRLKSVVAFA
jgi:hypothetical protein